jgi:hypothetical protein
MAIDKKLIDQLLADYKKPEDIIGENGLLKELTKAILERALEAEMTDHLGYEKHDPAGHHRGNTRSLLCPWIMVFGGEAFVFVHAIFLSSSEAMSSSFVLNCTTFTRRLLKHVHTLSMNVWSTSIS